jgi:hypothetical protein
MFERSWQRRRRIKQLPGNRRVDTERRVPVVRLDQHTVAAERMPGTYQPQDVLGHIPETLRQRERGERTHRIVLHGRKNGCGRAINSRRQRQREYEAVDRCQRQLAGEPREPTTRRLVQLSTFRPWLLEELRQVSRRRILDEERPLLLVVAGEVECCSQTIGEWRQCAHWHRQSGEHTSLAPQPADLPPESKRDVAQPMRGKRILDRQSRREAHRNTVGRGHGRTHQLTVTDGLSRACCPFTRTAT